MVTDSPDVPAVDELGGLLVVAGTEVEVVDATDVVVLKVVTAVETVVGAVVVSVGAVLDEPLPDVVVPTVVEVAGAVVVSVEEAADSAVVGGASGEAGLSPSIGSSAIGGSPSDSPPAPDSAGSTDPEGTGWLAAEGDSAATSMPAWT